MIIYAGLAEVSVARMFLGGFVPGILTGLGLILVLQVWNARAGWEPKSGSRPTLREVGSAIRASALALFAPVIIIGGIVGGVFTATEAGGAAAAYALVVSIAKREMGISAIQRALRNAATMTVMVMFPVGAATLFGWVLAREQFGTLAVSAMMSVSQGSSLLAAFVIVIFIIVLGFPIEGMTIMIVFVPILAPLGTALGYDPIHWGVVMVLAINLAGITPPVGGGIFLCSAMAKTDVQDTSRYIMPFLAVMTAVTLVSLIFPWTILWIPNLVLGVAK
jgi:C4-dicarboxylate transporter DctM subunit